MWRSRPNETGKCLTSVVLRTEKSSTIDLKCVCFFNFQNKEKAQKSKVWDSVSDSAPAQSAASPKPSSPDALKASTVSVATVSNINIAIDEDPGRKKSQGSKSVASHCQAVHLPASHNKGSGEPDSSAPPGDPPLHLKSVPSDAIKEEEEELVSKGLHIHLDKQTTNGDNSTDVLQDTNAKSSGPALKTYKSIQNNTVTLLRGAPTHPSEIQVSVPQDDVLWSYDIFTPIISFKESLESTEKLLEPFPAVVSIDFNSIQT